MHWKNIRILNTTRKNQDNTSTPVTKSTIPSRLAHKKYTATPPTEDNGVNTIVNKIVEEHNGRLWFEKQSKRKINVKKDEQNSSKWFIKETQESRIAVVKADKGGAILIVDPKMLETTVEEKLGNEDVYIKLEGDPTDSL